MFDYKCNGAVGGLVRLGRNQTHFFGGFRGHGLNAISFTHESSQSGQETSLIALSLKGLLLHVDETLGGEITQIEFDGIELLAYQEWIKPNNARENNALSQARKDWLTNYRGGWQLLVPNAGSECEVDGVFHPFHAKLIFNTGFTESIINVLSEISLLELVTLSTAVNFVKT